MTVPLADVPRGLPLTAVHASEAPVKTRLEQLGGLDTSEYRDHSTAQVPPVGAPQEHAEQLRVSSTPV